MKTCPNCGKEHTRRKIYCSDQCRWNTKNKRVSKETKSKIVEKECACCKQTFIPKALHPKYKYCSTTCKDKMIKSTEKYKAVQREYKREHRENNLDKLKQIGRQYYLKNKHMFLARNSVRRAKVKQATPIWANKQDIYDVYLEASYFGYHVDHIIPLNGTNVCGLHVWDNLQVLPPIENLRKGNKNSIHEEWPQRLSG